jgi:hypothetical protein
MTALRRLFGHRHNVTLFISSGRCGTQWLAAWLDATYDDLALTLHEPVGTAYRSSVLLREPAQGDVLDGIDVVRAHLARVSHTLRARDYIETGAPAYGVVPYFMARFPGQLRLLHVVRHPVHTAASIATHDRFSRTGADKEWQDAAMLDPRRHRVAQEGYEKRWEAMSDFEKSLFFWTEVNLYAAELHRQHPEVPFLRVRFEDLVDPGAGALSQLVDFLGLPARPGLATAREKVVDRWRLTSETLPHWRAVLDHPAAVALATEYGYSLEAVDEAALRARYVEGAAPADESGTLDAEGGVAAPREEAAST